MSSRKKSFLAFSVIILSFVIALAAVGVIAWQAENLLIHYVASEDRSLLRLRESFEAEQVSCYLTAAVGGSLAGYPLFMSDLVIQRIPRAPAEKNMKKRSGFSFLFFA